MRKIYKALIIGSGAAAYSSADWLYREGVRDIAIVTEGRLSGTSRNTGSDKQTYYKISMDGFTPDSPYKMASDMFAGGSCDGEKMYIEAVNSQRCFLRLCEYGVNFPTDKFGGYPGYKTDHDDTVRATSVGPLTSKKMTEKMIFSHLSFLHLLLSRMAVQIGQATEKHFYIMKMMNQQKNIQRM